VKGLSFVGGLAWVLTACAGGDSSAQSNPFGNSPTPGSGSAADDPNASGTDTDDLETTGISAGSDSAGEGTSESSPASSSSGAGSSDGGEPVCGDGLAQDPENCDGEDFAASTCADFGFDEGTLVCDGQCNILTDGCRSCEDGTLSPSELCDGDDLAGETCQSQGFGGGTLQCDSECTGFVTTGCTPLPTCGDGARNGAEACDGGDLGGASCQSLGFDAGALNCTASCTHDTSGCEFLNCGQQGDFCLFDENDPQGTCCPAGVGGNVLGICALAICQ